MTDSMQALPVTERKHAMGWLRPLPGRGALDLLPHADTSGIERKLVVDPRPWMPPALDQGQLGSCTANATNRAFRVETIHDGKDVGELSRLWTYYFERALEHTLGQGDTGAMGHDAFRVARHGIPLESAYPYVIADFEKKPPNVQPRAYRLHKPVHAVPQTERDFDLALSNDQTIPYGFTVYESFEAGDWASTTGVMPEPSAGEGVLGGHENLLVGYLPEQPDCYLSLNSWDTIWGVFGGYFFIPKAFVLNPRYASDFRTIVRPLASA